MNPPRRRGRPVELDPDRVARAALDLFRERGYDLVTMDDVARIVGHSRRTVFRHFPTKAALVLAETDHMMEGLESELSSIDPAREAIDAVSLAFGAVTRVSFHERGLLAQRLRLIGENRSLYSEALVRFADSAPAIRAMFVEREGLDPRGIEVAVIGDALALSALEALIWWARQADGDPGDAVEQSIRRFATGLRFRD
jgi:AcrR family transcriptional regulator